MPILVLFVSAGVSFDGTFSLFKTKLISHSSFTLQLFKTISGAFSKNNKEGSVKKSFLAIAGLLFRFLTLPSDSG